MTASNAQWRDPHTDPKVAGICRINTEIEQISTPYFLTERRIERWWSQARRLEGDGRSYWLLLARLAECALLCAGHYADNGECSAAGDLLVNPREILVHRRKDGRTTIKNRHEALSKQFGLDGIRQCESMKRFSADICLETSKPPLLPHMQHVLRESERISPSFIRRLAEAQCRIADTLAFLAAWRVFDSAELWQRLRECPAKETVLVESHLCRFDTRVFRKIGEDLRRSLADPFCRSPFLADPHAKDDTFKRSSTAAALNPASAPA
jgi:hypothetical protein